ncbi:MAG: DegV family protein [Pseudobutyrivibrio sp.]|nr:DegV family protein [Pseudobutyrivibrio sp.]
MADYVLSCCSTADVTEDFLKSKNIAHVCFHYYMDDKPFVDDLFKSRTPEEFYGAMVDGVMTRTSQVNADEYYNYFKKFMDEGKDIVHVTLSGGISGAINSAKIAEEQIKEEYPDRKIYVFDSCSASAGYGLIMDKLAELRDGGESIDDIVDFLEKNLQRQNTWFFTTDLTFFIRGGRISKVSGWFGTALNICPLLNVNSEGKLIPRQKCRGKKNVKKAALNQVLELIENGTDYNGKIFITHSVCLDDAREMADLLESALPNLAEPIKIFDIGPTIGAHTGPGTVAIGFWGAEKTL